MGIRINKSQSFLNILNKMDNYKRNYCYSVLLQIEFLNVLMFNGKVIGVRLKSVLGVKDYDYENASLILYDFLLTDIETVKDVPIIHLKDIGGRLCANERDKIPEGFYVEFTAYLENRRALKNFGKTDVTLKGMYNYYNKLIFDDLLPCYVGVIWNSRLIGAAGKCTIFKSGYAYISLSPHYHEKYPDELYGTLVHEMIHILYPADGHGKNFCAAMNEINALYPNLNISVNSREAAKINHLYRCSLCGREYPRARKINIYNVLCSCGGMIEEVNQD